MTLTNEVEQDRLLELLIENKISHVISFDDEWGENSTPEKTFLEYDLEQFLEERSYSLSSEEKTFLSNSDIITIADLYETIDGRVGKIKGFVEEKLDFKRNLDELEVLEELFSNYQEQGITFEKYPKKLGEVELETFKDKANRILFILDINMKNIGESEDVILESFLRINSIRKDKLDIAIIYSNEDLEHYKNHQEKLMYINEALKVEENRDLEKQLIAYQLWAIKKVKEKTTLANELNTILKDAVFGHVLSKYLSKKNEINIKTFGDLLKYSEEDFENIFKDAFIEGESILNVFRRINEGMVLRNDHATKKSDMVYIEAIEMLLEISQKKSKKVLEENEPNTKISKIRTDSRKKKIEEKKFEDFSEYGLIDYTINDTLEDLQTGDIFKLATLPDNVERFGILITPSCDLPLRFKEKLSDALTRNEQTLSILLFEKKDIDEIKNKIACDNAFKYIWPVVENDSSGKKYIALEPKNKVLHIDSNLVDLCTLNTNGEANLNVDEDLVTRYKGLNFSSYYSGKLSKWINDIQSVEYYTSDDVLVSSMNGNQKRYLELLASYKYSVCYSDDEKRFTLNRIGRLNSNYTLKIIETFANKISRIGVEPIPIP